VEEQHAAPVSSNSVSHSPTPSPSPTDQDLEDKLAEIQGVVNPITAKLYSGGSTGSKDDEDLQSTGSEEITQPETKTTQFPDSQATFSKLTFFQ
jgi:hypothetical protein